MSSPDIDPKKGAAYQMGRRRFTAVPGYASTLPRVFPFKIRLSLQHAQQCIEEMMEAEYAGFAVTSHPATTDGHVHLWVSVEMAEYLTFMDLVSSGMLEGTQ